MTDAQLLAGFRSESNSRAFELLVRRYGPMVWRVCRDGLGDTPDAEDAFQATFLVFVRRAGSIREGDAVGSWLHGVAQRVAMRARHVAARRRERERQVEAMTAVSPAPGDDVDRRELRPLIHAELARLPAKYRVPLVLCYLEGHTYDEAARRLRLPLGTFKNRLGKGRELIRSRLARRGVVVASMLLLFLLGETAEAVPDELIDSTVYQGVLSADRRVIPETIPRSVAALAEHELTISSLRSLSWVGAGLALSVTALALWLALGPAVRRAPGAVPSLSPDQAGHACVVAPG
jgi:RNA polymerase sigma factor (sigma-70 family)